MASGQPPDSVGYLIQPSDVVRIASRIVLRTAARRAAFWQRRPAISSNEAESLPRRRLRDRRGSDTVNR